MDTLDEMDKMNAMDTMDTMDTMARCIDGIYRSNGVIAFCNYGGHKGYLTRKMVIEKDCVKKGCKYFRKTKDDQYFVSIARKAEIKKEKKEKKKEKKTAKRKLESRINSIKEVANWLFAGIRNFKIKDVSISGCIILVRFYCDNKHIDISRELKALEDVFGLRAEGKYVKVDKSVLRKILGDNYIEDEREAQESNILRIIETSKGNMMDIVTAEKCGCYTCKNIFSSSEVVESEKGKVFDSGICPYCGKSTVIQDSSGYEVNMDILKQINKYLKKRNKAN